MAKYLSGFNLQNHAATSGWPFLQAVRNASSSHAVKSISGFIWSNHSIISVITEELMTFLGKEPGTMMSRVEVSKGINEYITTNSLKDKTSGRQINADAKLAALLKLGKDDVLTYFNLQRFLNIHFVKKPVVA